MKYLRCLSPAVVLLLLSVTGLDMEHLQAENLNLLSPDEHKLVLNRGMRGIYLCRLSLPVWLFFPVCFSCGFGQKLNMIWENFQNTSLENHLIFFKRWIHSYLWLSVKITLVDVSLIPTSRSKSLIDSLMISIRSSEVICALLKGNLLENF